MGQQVLSDSITISHLLTCEHGQFRYSESFIPSGRFRRHEIPEIRSAGVLAEFEIC
jgi:hypothetical protein